MKSSSTSSPLEDIEFLARSVHRATALDALSRRPQSRADLLSITGVSQSTMGRTLREFENRDWIRRDGKAYEATATGAFVASGMRDLVDRVRTEQTLREVWGMLPDETSGFSLEIVADAVVTVADSDDPYRPVNRFLTLVRETEQFRFAGFNVALLQPCKDELCRRIVEGMRSELIDPPNVIQYIRSSCSEQFSETLENGDLTIRVHNDLPPYGIGIFDDRIAISGYDPSGGTVKVLIDTDDPAARDWAESVYDTYRRETPTLSLDVPTR